MSSASIAPPLYSAFKEQTIGVSLNPTVDTKCFLYEQTAFRRNPILTSLPAKFLIGSLRLFALPALASYGLGMASRKYLFLNSMSAKILKVSMIGLVFFAAPLLLARSPRAQIINSRINAYIFSDKTGKSLVSAINRPNLSAQELGKLDEEEQLGGQCAGASLYFNYLYLNTRQDPRTIAYNFVLGAPPEAITLHKSLGHLMMDPQKIYEANSPYLLTLVPSVNENSLKEGKVTYQNRDDLLRLENGPHLMRINLGRSYDNYHALSLIKESNQHMYIFDPARGLFEFKGENVAEQINAFFNQAYGAVYKYHIACYNRKKYSSNKQFTPVDFSNFHVMILPCFKSSATFIASNPKDGMDAWVITPRTYSEYLHHLVFEEAVDRMKSWI